MRLRMTKRVRVAEGEADTTARWRLLVSAGMTLLTVLHLALPGTLFERETAQAVQWGLMLLYAVLLWFSTSRGPGGVAAHLERVAGAELVVTILGLGMGWWWPALATAGALLLLAHAWSGYLWLLARGVNPGLVFVGSFALLICVGTGGLMLPQSTPAGARIGWIDALFTATSAVCVTGLVVRDTGTEFTRFGQSIILVLMQLGGLGMILFGALVATMFGSTISLKAVHAMAESSPGGVASASAVRRLVVFAGVAVFGLEAAGAAALYLGWPSGWEGGPGALDSPADRLFHSVFFSVSAFCNAGFATCATGLEGLRNHWTCHVVVAGLVVIGGLGLPVMANLWHLARAKIRRKLTGRRRIPEGGALIRLSLHSRLVLVTSAVLYLAGLAVIFVSETALRSVPAWQAILDAHFMSIASRTAGFNTVPTPDTGPLARFALMILMFLGGSPGSTAGGLKTVATAILAILVWRTITGRSEVDAFGRRLPGEMIRRAVVLLLLNVSCVTLVAAGVVLTEGIRFPAGGGAGSFESYFFESVSACATVGLSLGATPTLSEAGRLVIIAGMFVGRVGSLALLVALVGLARRPGPRYAYPTEGVVLS